MDIAPILDTITELSKEFGQEVYVRGGGGNTSCKTEDSLYIKPSGITLLEMTPQKFLGLDRNKLKAMFDAAFPAEPSQREKAVVEFVAGTVLPGFSGRPSVEAPLHNSFPQRYVVHTHPALVNGLTCGNKGEEICAATFPGAMWLGMHEPGYTIGVMVNKAMREYETKNGKAPSLLFLGNHGLFVAGDTAEEVRASYKTVMDGLAAIARRNDVDPNVAPCPVVSSDKAKAAVDGFRSYMGDHATCFAAIDRIPLYDGALTPDHIVYCGAAMYDGDGSEASLKAFHEKNGYWPKVVGLPDMVVGLGKTQRPAELAAELAWDAANVVRIAGAFGGVKFMEQKFIDFIMNWEVESYRQKAMQ